MVWWSDNPANKSQWEKISKLFRTNEEKSLSVPSLKSLHTKNTTQKSKLIREKTQIPLYDFQLSKRNKVQAYLQFREILWKTKRKHDTGESILKRKRMKSISWMNIVHRISRKNYYLRRIFSETRKYQEIICETILLFIRSSFF